MKFTRSAIAGILALSAVATASAQQFPVVPDRTVIGRIGVGGQSGPSQAIPFTSFLPALVGSQSINMVFAAPSSGVAGLPSFRLLVGADIPQINLATSGNGGVSATLPLAKGGLGGSQAAATANQIPVYPGSGGAAVPTSAPTWFDNAYCNTAGFLIARFAGAWTCARGVPLDVTWLGAVGDGTTDNSTIINGAINTLVSTYGGGTIRIPPAANVYCVFSGISVNTGLTTNGDIQIVGTAVRYSALSACNHNTTVVTLNNQFASLRDVAVYGYGGPTDPFVGGVATLPAISVGSLCSYCLLHHVYAAFGAVTIQNVGNYATYDNVAAQYAYGTASNGSAIFYNLNSGPQVHHSTFDQVWPVSTPARNTSVSTAWTNAHVYTAGQVATFSCNSRTWIYQVQTSGTSAGSQPACQNYGVLVNDNTAKWLLVSPATYYCVQADTGTNEFDLVNADMTCTANAGFAMTNTLAGTAPQAIEITNTTFGLNYVAGVQLTSGTGFTIINSEVSGCLIAGCVAFQTTSTWTGPALIFGNRVINSVSYGLQSLGGNNLNFSNNFVSTADTLSILFQPTASGAYSFNIVNNIVSGTGITISANVAAGSRYTVHSNNCGGAAFTDSSAGGTGYPVRGAAMNAANCF